MSNDQLIDIQDMGLAAALLCHGYELLTLEPTEERSRYTFRFKTGSNLEDSIHNYWSGKLLVDAKRFWSESKNLKTRLYSLR